jgi:hypothetical protein
MAEKKLSLKGYPVVGSLGPAMPHRPDDPLPHVQALLARARQARDSLQIAEDAGCFSEHRKQNAASFLSANLAGSDLIGLHNYFRDKLGYEGPRVGLHEWFHIGRYIDFDAAYEEEYIRCWNLEDDEGLKRLRDRKESEGPQLGARLQKKFDVGLNLLGKSVWGLYDCWQPDKPKARRKANRFALYGSMLTDLRRSVGMLENIVATWPVPSAANQAPVPATPTGERTREIRKRPKKEVHLHWKELHNDGKGLSHQQIKMQHEQDTGEELTVGAVQHALKRLEKEDEKDRKKHRR